MIYDPEIEVICDNCEDSIQVTPVLGFADYSGKTYHYDCTDESVRKQLKSEGWTFKNGKDLCEGCS